MDPSASLRLAVAVCAAVGSFDSGAALSTPTGKPPLPAMARSCPECHGPVEHRRIVITGDTFTDLRFDAAMTRFAEALQEQAEMRRVQAWAPSAGDGAADLPGPPPEPRSESPRADAGSGNPTLAPGWPFALLLALAWLVHRRA
jgi:hypothetical protein